MRPDGRRKMARRQPCTRKMKAVRSPPCEAGGTRRRAPAGAEGAAHSGDQAVAVSTDRRLGQLEDSQDLVVGQQERLLFHFVSVAAFKIEPSISAHLPGKVLFR